MRGKDQFHSAQYHNHKFKNHKKVSVNIASEASYVYINVTKNAKNGQFLIFGIF